LTSLFPAIKTDFPLKRPILRDTIKAIGTDKIRPTTFGIFYDDLEKPKTGGTGHIMIICEKHNIPITDQKDRFN